MFYHIQHPWTWTFRLFCRYKSKQCTEFLHIQSSSCFALPGPKAVRQSLKMLLTAGSLQRPVANILMYTATLWKVLNALVWYSKGTEKQLLQEVQPQVHHSSARQLLEGKVRPSSKKKTGTSLIETFSRKFSARPHEMWRPHECECPESVFLGS